MVRIPAGPARKNLCNSSSLLRMISYWFNCSSKVIPNTVLVLRWIRPARSNSPNKPIMPPARCTSSMWYLLVFGAILLKQGTTRDKRSISAILKSTPASCAAANKCKTVLLEPPIAISKLMAFSKASKVPIERGNTLSSSCS